MHGDRRSDAEYDCLGWREALLCVQGLSRWLPRLLPVPHAGPVGERQADFFRGEFRREIGARDLGVVDAGPFEVRAAEIHPAQVCLAEIAVLKSKPAARKEQIRKS